MNSFKTRSSARKNVMVIVYTFASMFFLAFFALKISVTSWLYIEGLLLIACIFCIALVAKTHWEIEFKENSISLYNTGNYQSFFLENLKRSQITVKQTEKQKRKNRGDLRVADTPFRMYDVEHCSEMIQYIQEYVPEKRKRT